MKIQKGDAGYLRRRKRLLILEAVVSFGLVAALVIAGYVTTKTKLNLLTVDRKSTRLNSSHRI